MAIEGLNFITPMERAKDIQFPLRPAAGIDGSVSQSGETDSPAAAVPFKSVFQSAIDAAVNAEQQTAIDTEKLMTGDIDDLHTLGIDSTKAYLSVRLLVEMRNKALDSYNELMRTNL